MTALERGSSPEPRIPVSPQLALRVAIIGGLAMVMFGVIFFRLWYLQVLTGEQYAHLANVNRTRDLPIPAPRGEIVDRSGQPIVTSETTNAVQVVPSELPGEVAVQAHEYLLSLEAVSKLYRPALARLERFEATIGSSRRRLTRAERSEQATLRRAAEPPVPAVPALPRSASAARDLFDRLGAVINLSPRIIDERVIEGMSATPYANVTVKTDAGRGALVTLGERQSEFPGVLQRPIPIRSYPYGEMAAQLLGHVGEVSTEELSEPAFKHLLAGTIVGQEGLEYYYDSYLRGKTGVERVQVNSQGQRVAGALAEEPAKAGLTLKTTLDLPLQQESERALREGIDHARAGGKPAISGAFVALDPLNGEVLAGGSYPSYDPGRFAKPLTPAEFKELEQGGSAAARLVDRMAHGEYPTGSTFKPITAMAALEHGVITPSEGLGAGQCIVAPGGEKFCNAGEADYGAVGLVDALKVSSDTYFFEVGERANGPADIIQKEAHELGVGEETGIDLPGEFPGVVPDQAWRAQRNREELACEHRTHRSSCGIVAEVRPWYVGDNMDLAVGQGDLLTDPLQMAVAYSTLANAYRNGGNGTVVTPHIGTAIEEPSGALVQSLKFPPKRHVHLNEGDLDLVMEGIHDAASESGGTSAPVWEGWDQQALPVYGKTGTAERGSGHEDQSWYMCYIGSPSHPIVIAVTVEEGGFGAETAAPIARLIASQYYGKPLKFQPGTSKTL